MSKVKYYTFKAGSAVPSWMAKVSSNFRAGYFKNRSGKITFGTSCVVARFFGHGYKFMPAGNAYTENGGINICGITNAEVSLKGGKLPNAGCYVNSL